MRTDYKNLLARRDELDNDFLRAMVELLSTYGKDGRVAFIPDGFTEDDDITEYDEDFPITITLWGEHDNPTVDITEMFLSENGVTVYARGIDTEIGCICNEDFEIYTDHYYYALSFILIVLEQQGVKF